MVYSRELDGEVLTLAPSGWTFGANAGTSTFVLIDKETESLWFPMVVEGKEGLVGISGSHADEFLEKVQEM